MNNWHRFQSLAALVLLAAAGSAQAASCDRACLEGFVDRYFDALLAHEIRRPAMRKPSTAALRRTAKLQDQSTA